MTVEKPEILDLDKLKPRKRLIKLSGKEIDVSTIPSEVTLEIVEKADVIESESAESFDLVFDMIIKICNVTNPDDGITKEWLVKNTSLEQLTAMMEFVMKPIRERVETNTKNKARPNNKK